MYTDRYEAFKKSFVGQSTVRMHIQMEKIGYVHDEVRELPNGGIEVMFFLTSGGFTLDVACFRSGKDGRITSVR